MPIKANKKPIKRNSRITRSKPPRATKVKKTVKRLPLEKKTATELIKIADREFGHYIRLRDSEYVKGEWAGPCIDCNKKIVNRTREGKWTKSGNVGHYIGRGIHQLRYDEINCNLQSSYCNAWEDKDKMLRGYSAALDKKYGSGTTKRLREEASQEGSRKMLTKPELLQIIRDCRTRIAIMLESRYN